MMPAGLWLRPAYYGPKDGAAEAIAGRCRAVRHGVGLIDVSTLGGLDIRGPDAAAFVDRMYTWNYAEAAGRPRPLRADDRPDRRRDRRWRGLSLPRPALLCHRDDERRRRVYRQMTWWNQQWRMDVDVANVTAAYAAVNIAGPRAARGAGPAGNRHRSFGRRASPTWACGRAPSPAFPVRILRVGFVGELGFEIHCPSGLGEALWDRLMEAGQSCGITPFGVEAQRVLRLEKGHIIIGQDTDGLTNPAEAGMDWALSKTKPFYVGKRAVDMQIAKGVLRRLVGFTLTEPTAPCPKECHLVIDGATRSPAASRRRCARRASAG